MCLSVILPFYIGKRTDNKHEATGRFGHFVCCHARSKIGIRDTTAAEYKRSMPIQALSVNLTQKYYVCRRKYFLILVDLE